MPDIRELKDRATRHFSKGKYEKAVSVYEELCQLEPKDMQVRVRLGDAYVKCDQRAKAVSVYRVAAETYAREGLLPRAIAVCKLILELEPEHVATQQTLAQLYARKSGVSLDGAAPKRPAAALGTRASAAPRRPEPAAQAPQVAAPAVAEVEEVELDTRERSFEPGGRGAGQALEPEAPDSPGLELQAAGEQADWKGAPAWEPPEAEKPVEAAEAAPESPREPAEPQAPVPAPSEVLLEIELSPEEIGLPPGALAAEPVALEEPEGSPAEREPAQAASPAAPAEARPERDDVLFAGDGSAGFSLGDIDLGEPELVGIKTAPAARAEPQTVEASAGQEAREAAHPAQWFEPPEGSAPTSLVDLEIARVDEDAEIEVLVVSSDQPQGVGDLPQIPLFSDLSREAFIDLASRCTLVRPQPGETIVQEGSVGRSFFVVSSGSVKVCKGDVVVARLKEGSFFGEMALLSGAPRAASVVAEEDTECLEISASLLAGLQRRYPHVRQVLKRFARQRLLANVMATSPLFRPFDKKTRNGLVERFKSREVGEGEVVLSEGRMSDGLFVLMSGELEVSKTKEGAEVPLAALKEGDVFGEISLLTKSPATATVRAAKRSTVLRLPREDFDEVISLHPQILMLVSELSDERLQILQALEAGTVEAGEEGLMLV
ncbi:MAG: cyclic nucleotide-binding domain-containing protein [Myxococcales bacterium]|jgi:CRP-like cAMP-binding protein